MGQAGGRAEHLPVAVQRGLLSASSEINDENAVRYKESYAKMRAYAGRMFIAGVPLLAGTDTWAGFGLHRELELYVLAGIPPLQTLKIATWIGAKYTQTLDRRGSIERGKLADLVLVEGDPSANISDIRKTSLVLKGGVAYSPAQVYEALASGPSYPRPRLLAYRPSSPERGHRACEATRLHWPTGASRLSISAVGCPVWVYNRNSRFPSPTRFAVALGEVPVNAARQRSFVVTVTASRSRQLS
jgi:hypothetical protein